MARLLLYSEGIIEATWLTVLISVPVYFSVLGERIQSEKNHLLHSMAALLMAAWIIRIFAQWNRSGLSLRQINLKPGSVLKIPCMASVVALVVAWIISTVFSLSPWESFWGTSHRREGLFTHLSCVLFFASMMLWLRTEQQITRVVTAMIAASIPICLYGIGQRFAMDPMVTNEDFSFRVGSTFANPAFLAGYLALLLPLTIARFLSRLSSLREGEHQKKQDRLQGFFYGGIAFLQLLTLFITVSRGAVVGLLAGGCVLTMVRAIYTQRRWPAWVIFGTGILLLASLLLLSNAPGPLKTLAELPTVERFVQMLDPKSGASGRFSIWQVSAHAATFSRTKLLAEEVRDPFHRLRFLFGYGPEQVPAACLPYRSVEFNSEWKEFALPDRAHNDIWEALLTTGLFGLAAYLSLNFLVFYHACTWLGLVNTSRLRWIFWAFMLGGAAAGGIGLAIWQNAGFLGVGLRLGSTLGLIGYLVWGSWNRVIAPAAPPESKDQAFLLAGLLAGMVAHWNEVAFAFTTETTQLYFWTYLALLLTVARRLTLFSSPSPDSYPGRFNLSDPQSLSSELPDSSQPQKVATGKRRPLLSTSAPSWKPWREQIVGGFLGALVLAHLGAMPILTFPQNVDSAVEAIARSFTTLPGSPASNWWMVPMTLCLTWLLFALGWKLELAPDSAAKPKRRSLTVLLAVSAGGAMLYWWILAQHATRMMALGNGNLDNLDRYWSVSAFTVDLHYGFTFLLIAFLGAFIAQTPAARPGPLPSLARSAVSAAAALAGLMALLLLLNSTLRWSKAGVMMNRADSFRRSEQWTFMAAASRAAIEYESTSGDRYITLSQALREQALRVEDAGQRKDLFEKAARVLEQGHQHHPWSPYFFGWRGDLYAAWAEAETAQTNKPALAAQAIEYYQQAASLDPGGFDWYNRMAYVELNIRQAPGAARRLLKQALDHCNSSHQTYGLWGDTAFQEALEMQRTNSLRLIRFAEAATNYLKALDLVRTNGLEGFRLAVALGKAQVQLGELHQAIGTYQVARRLSPPADRWQQEERLARLNAAVKDWTNALLHVQQALQLAPQLEHPDLHGLQEYIGTHLKSGGRP